MKTPATLHSSVLLALLFFFHIPLMSGQNVVNGNFDEWEMVGEVLQPVGWTTTNSPEVPLAPVSAHQSTDACSGDFSLKLTSTGPSFEGPGPGRASQVVNLNEYVTSVSMSFLYAADTLLDQATGRVQLQGMIVVDGEITGGIATATLDIVDLTMGCADEILSISSSEPFNAVRIELWAMPHFTPIWAEGLSVIRYDNIQLDVTSSVAHIDLSAEIAVMPNPTTGLLSLQHNDLRVHEIQLLSVSGALLREIPVNHQFIDISDLPVGLYMLRIFTDEGTAVKKVVKH